MVSRSPTPDARPPAHRLVLLGASNLSRGLPTLLATARRAWAEPLDVLAAPGRGRSYGLTTSLLGRGLSGILACGLWAEMDRRTEMPTCGLVSDVGNDIMYGVPVDQILEWVDEALRRLRSRGASAVVTSLPTERLKRLGPRSYEAMRSVFFPRNRSSFAESRSRMEAVDCGVRRLAAGHGARLIELPAAWYGIDPIHIRRAHWSTAWSTVVEAWRPPLDVPRMNVATWTWCAAQMWRPAERRWFGLRDRRVQPCATFADGTRVSLY